VQVCASVLRVLLERRCCHRVGDVKLSRKVRRSGADVASGSS